MLSRRFSGAAANRSHQIPIETQEDTRFWPRQSIQQFRRVYLSSTSKDIQQRLAGDDHDLQTRFDGERPLLVHAGRL